VLARILSYRQVPRGQSVTRLERAIVLRVIRLVEQEKVVVEGGGACSFLHMPYYIGYVTVRRERRLVFEVLSRCDYESCVQYQCRTLSRLSRDLSQS
jgi:hypothetical protein